MAPFIDVWDDMEPYHVSFKYFEYSLDLIDASSITLWWKRPSFLTADPETFLDPQKNEIYEWLYETYGENAYGVRERQPHDWTVYFFGDTNNAKLVLFKLRWGDNYNWTIG